LSSDDIEPFDWYRRFFGGGMGRRGFGTGFFDDMFRGFDQINRKETIGLLLGLTITSLNDPKYAKVVVIM
jgi:hypothetical protein